MELNSCSRSVSNSKKNKGHFLAFLVEKQFQFEKRVGCFLEMYG